MIAAGVWIVLMLLFMEILGLYTLGRPWAYGLMAVLFVVVFYVFERIVLLERRAFTCKRCGYDLQGLTENRCPECGTGFDPAERERILARIASPAPKPRHTWTVVALVIFFTLTTALGLVVWRKASMAAAGRAAVPTTTQPSPTTSTGGQ